MKTLQIVGKVKEMYGSEYDLDMDITPTKLCIYPYLADRHASVIVFDPQGPTLYHLDSGLPDARHLGELKGKFFEYFKMMMTRPNLGDITVKKVTNESTFTKHIKIVPVPGQANLIDCAPYALRNIHEILDLGYVPASMKKLYYP
jgi:hypothetical protein